MNNLASTPSTEDSAWAAVNTPLNETELVEFCQDVERLFRINPLLEFRSFKALGDSRYTMTGRNISQEPFFDFDITFKAVPQADGVIIEYDNGIKSRTVVKIESAASGSKLNITDHYDRMTVEDRENHLNEVDRSLVRWAEYLQQYLVMWKRWRRFGAWRWYMRHVWQPMKPMGRRITYVLLWVSVVEMALIALGAGIWFAEYG